MLKFAQRTVINFILVLLFLVLLFHFAILTEVIPYTVVWGGKLKSKQQMIGFETISIIVNLVIFLFVCLKGQYVHNAFPKKLINAFLWVFFVIFSLNTFGNLFAESIIERIIFTPLTLLLAISFWLILKDKKN